MNKKESVFIACRNWIGDENCDNLLEWREREKTEGKKMSFLRCEYPLISRFWYPCSTRMSKQVGYSFLFFLFYHQNKHTIHVQIDRRVKLRHYVPTKVWGKSRWRKWLDKRRWLNNQRNGKKKVNIKPNRKYKREKWEIFRACFIGQLERGN